MIKSKPLEPNINAPEYVGISEVPPELNIHVRRYARIQKIIRHVHMQYLVILSNFTG